MSDELLVLMIGLLVGGSIGILALAFVLAGSDRRHPRAPEAPWATAADPAATVSVTYTSFIRVDLLHPLHDTTPVMGPWSVDANELDIELQLLLRRYGRPSGT